jgi:hypothetical protein
MGVVGVMRKNKPSSRLHSLVHRKVEPDSPVIVSRNAEKRCVPIHSHSAFYITYSVFNLLMILLQLQSPPLTTNHDIPPSPLHLTPYRVSKMDSPT